MTKTENENAANKVVQEYLYPEGDITPLFAICDVLQVPARVVAKELDITTSQMSHYRTGQTPVPAHRMGTVLSLLRKLIVALEKEIARERRKNLDKMRLDLIKDLENRIELARKIAGLSA